MCNKKDILMSLDSDTVIIQGAELSAFQEPILKLLNLITFGNYFYAMQHKTKLSIWSLRALKSGNLVVTGLELSTFQSISQSHNHREKSGELKK